MLINQANIQVNSYTVFLTLQIDSLAFLPAGLCHFQREVEKYIKTGIHPENMIEEEGFKYDFSAMPTSETPENYRLD